MHPDHKWKAAFITEYGLYQPTGMFYGLCNSPATFQQMMNHYFHVPIAQGWCKIYMDDILIGATDKQTLHDQTLIILQILADNDLYLKPEKCAESGIP